MSKVLTFSRVFPSYHPRKGEPTYFVEKIYKSLYLAKVVPEELASSFNFAVMNDESYQPKHHTIRAGHRWKVGDKFSPRVWSGKPYQSKQIIIAPDIEIKKVWDIRIHTIAHWINYSGMMFPIDYKELAKNDGLSTKDFLDWFGNPTQKGFKFHDVFFGQIICWNENIEY
jgi:hypothetical protein